MGMIIPDKNDPVFLAWAAAWVDTEGSIGMTYASDKYCRGGYILYRIRINIAQTVKEPLDLILSAFGGHIHEISNRKTKKIFYYNAHSRKAAFILETLLPFIIVKKKQAELAIKAANLISTNRGSRAHPRASEITEELENIKNQLHDLNGWSPERRMAAKKKSKEIDHKRLDRWAKDFDSCIQCGRSNIRHAARGLCMSCNGRLWRHKHGGKIGKSRVSGQWSAISESCISCHSSDVKHHSHGYCYKCYFSVWRKEQKLKNLPA